LVAALSAGAPLALNIESVKSPFGFAIFLLAVAFHLSSFVAGYILSGFVFRDSPDVKPLQRTISFETGTKLFIHQILVCSSIIVYVTLLNKFICLMAVGMQSSLLALALANRFFEDPVVGMPSAISVSFPSSIQ
jgi:BASS family bile acid:Na+ symporter